MEFAPIESKSAVADFSQPAQAGFAPVGTVSTAGWMRGKSEFDARFFGEIGNVSSIFCCT
jgi:hypothetical protein